MMNSNRSDGPLLSFVFPCLNEEETLQNCIKEVRDALKPYDWSYEIIVADNGSEDRSPQIALNEGISLVEVLPQGYGAALQGGITESKGKWVAFCDADGTYYLEDLPKILKSAEESDADMVLANRFGPRLSSRAMPLLHRYLGTPLLALAIRLLHGNKIKDCNSGFRCLKRESYLKWQPKSIGMEFASELLIRAIQENAKIIEISSGLRVSPRKRESKLSTWRDGMRHLLEILYHAPRFFERIGFLMIIIGFFGHLTSLLFGRIRIGNIEVMDVHTRILFLVLRGI